MGLVVAPIVEGKLEAWKSWTKDLTGSHKNEFDDFNKRYGLTRHDVWLVESPAGYEQSSSWPDAGKNDLSTFSMHQRGDVFKIRDTFNRSPDVSERM